jgi:hypothetical protein
LQDRAQEGRGLLDVLDDFEEGDDIEAFFWRFGKRQGFDGDVVVGEAAGLEEQGIGALVAFRDGDDFGGRVDGGHGVGCCETSGGFCEDAAAAADVEVFSLVAWRERRRGAEAFVDEGMAVLVHEVEEAAGALRVPPF